MRTATLIALVMVLYAVSVTATPLHDVHEITKRGFTSVSVTFSGCITLTFSGTVDAVSPGTQTVTITVTDQDGQVTTDTVTILAGATDFSSSFSLPNKDGTVTISACRITNKRQTGCQTSTEDVVACQVQQDPHMTTFDGVKYNFQGLCTYVLTQDCRDVTNPSFQITADFRGKYSELREKPLTRVDAVNINVGGVQLVKLLKNNNFLIKGQLYTNSSAVIGNNEGTIEMVGDDLFVKLNEPKIRLSWSKNVRGVMIDLQDENMHGNVCGLLGNSNGNPDDEFITANGEMLSKDDIYEFGNSWEVPNSCP